MSKRLVATATLATLVVFHLGGSSAALKSSPAPGTRPSTITTITFAANPQHTGDYHTVGPIKTARLRWTFDTPREHGDTGDGAIFGAPAAADGIVSFTSMDGHAYGVDVQSAEQVWHLQPGEAATSPAIAEGTVYIAGGDNVLYALDSRTGRRRWMFDTGPWGGDSSPVVVDGVVYVGGGADGLSLEPTSHLYAFDARNGGVLWRFATAGQGVGSSPAVADGRVYFVAPDETLVALDAASGTERWRFAVEPTVAAYEPHASPAVADGVVYFVSGPGRVYALDARTGRLRWRSEARVPVPPPPGSAPAVSHGLVYVADWSGARSRLLAIDAGTGKTRWEFAGSSIDKSPAVAGDMLYVADRMTLRALDAGTGRLRWSFEADALITSPPAVVNGVVYFGTPRRLWAIE